MNKYIKNVLSCILVFMMICSMSMLSVSASELDVELSDEELAASILYQEQALQKIEANIDEIHAEADEYQRTHQNLKAFVYDDYRYLDGDIIVSKSTSSAGILGHAGIVVGEKILEITPTYNGGIPAAISFETWFERYPESIVIRYKYENRNVPVDAAWEGQTFYIDGDGADNKYTVASSITSRTKDYCSSLVWKCFYRGSDFEFITFTDTPSGGVWGRPGTIFPYDFVTFAKDNEFSAVYYINW